MNVACIMDGRHRGCIQNFCLKILLEDAYAGNVVILSDVFGCYVYSTELSLNRVHELPCFSCDG